MKIVKLSAIIVIAFAALAMLPAALARPFGERAVTLPPPHLGYGVNVRANLDMAAALGFEWVKLYEDVIASPDLFPPETERYHVLYRLRADGQPTSTAVYLAHVAQIVTAGLGRVAAYEIGNEPNIRQFWGEQNPSPEHYAHLLCNSYALIKSIDPAAVIVSAGLAPVGRTAPAIWNLAMDDRVYTQRLLDAIAADFPDQYPCFDAFGFHPQGFPYPPELEADQLPPDDNGNDFRFRMTEWYHQLLAGRGLGHIPLWLTEFGWLRDPGSDPYDGTMPFPDYSWCLTETSPPWAWMRVSEAQQADYLVRAFQYADAHMPWVGAMFVFNLDWNSQGWDCNHVKFFSVYKAATGRPDTDPLTRIPAQAVGALAAMPKRSAYSVAALGAQPDQFTFLTEVATPTVQSATLSVINLATSVNLTWTIGVTPTDLFEITVAPITGVNSTSVTLQIDTQPITAAGWYTAHVIITAEPTDTLNNPFTVPLTVRAVDQLQRIHLPLTARNYAAPQPPAQLELGLAFISSAEAFASETRYGRATAIGGALNRWPMYWPSIEKNPVTQPRVFDWSRQDTNVIADINHGLEIVPILMLTPIGLDTGGSRSAPAPKVGDGLKLLMNPSSPDRPAAPSSQGSPPQGLYLSIFTDGTDEPGVGKTINPDNRWAYFVNAAVNRYKPGGALAQAQGWDADTGIHYWEIWNEQDLDQFFIGTPADYARLLKVAYLAGKQADPNAVIVFGGMAHFEKPNWLLDTLNVIATDPMSITHHGFMDAVASHNYAWAWRTFGYLLNDRQRLDAKGLTAVKLWITETGLPVCDDSPIDPFNFCPSPYRGTLTEQVDFLLQTAAWSAWMQAEKMIWFQLYDDVGNACPYDFFGLVRNPSTGPCVPNTGLPRPAYDAYPLARQLFGDVQPYWRKRPTANQEIIAFKRPETSQRVLAMWTRTNVADTVVISATSTSALLIFPDGSSQTITPVNGNYAIDLPAATNYSTPTSDGTAAIGGRPRFLIEHDPAVR